MHVESNPLRNWIFFVFKSKFEWLFMSSSDLYFGCMNSHSVISKSREALELFLYIEF